MQSKMKLASGQVNTATGTVLTAGSTASGGASPGEGGMQLVAGTDPRSPLGPDRAEDGGQRAPGHHRLAPLPVVERPVADGGQALQDRVAAGALQRSRSKVKVKVKATIDFPGI